MKNKIAYRNKSEQGWWVANLLERFEFYDEDKNNLNRMCTAWENTILLKADNREEAYKKAINIGKSRNKCEAWDDKGNKGIWIFEGLTNLLPVYEELNDGSEILWTEHRRAVKTIKSWIVKKKLLAVFKD